MKPTAFEIEHGYTPCFFRLGRDGCRYTGQPDECAKTIEDCKRLGQFLYFGGSPTHDPEVIKARAAVRIAEACQRWRKEDGLE